MTVRVGDYIRDLERVGAYGTVTGVFQEGAQLVARYQMDYEASEPLWRDYLRKLGKDNWHTGAWELTVSQAKIDSLKEDATYYDAITQSGA